MTVKVAVVMDPIQQINPKKDSTLAMLLAAQTRGWPIHYVEQSGLTLKNGQVWLNYRPLRVSDDLESWFEFLG